MRFRGWTNFCVTKVMCIIYK
uniref:Uncharacterized protein n=1 Tax=Arundo donax TaxID=35708 RepID=A0A0A8ZB48_ARUDO